jgi:hypothetical protein
MKGTDTVMKYFIKFDIDNLYEGFPLECENKVYRGKSEAAAVDFNGHVEEVNHITFLNVLMY